MTTAVGDGGSGQIHSFSHGMCLNAAAAMLRLMLVFQKSQGGVQNGECFSLKFK